jgi:hypothetical protein
MANKEKLKITATSIASDAVEMSTRLMTRIGHLQDRIPEDEWQFDEKIQALFDALDVMEDAAAELEAAEFIFPE